ncbi:MULTISPECIES: DMT family transporter [unclassified Nostoc]|uniref:DMT family transporter n=1 Tax=unclassified Nostoc TaxID=2593658 RepID=UPI002AD29A29|nr:EamA family transporter [Nostoc sp. DedQUE03]MDZ7971904.1 EamA family transporter [Nostoc sp. DedQUE03]MDZ8046885.1 EamA family transporter [Nostoc sp. DedQUE02]
MNVSNQTKIAIASLFLGVGAISFGSIFMKLSEIELSPSATVFNRFWLASVVFLLWHGYKAIRQRFSGDKPVEQQPYTSQDILLLLGAGILWAATLVLLAWSLTETSVAISSVLHNLAPIFTSLGVWLLFRQRFENQFLMGMVIALGGAIAIEFEELQIATDEVQGGLAAIVSAVLLSAYLLIVEKLRTKFSPATIQLWICAIAALVILPILLFTQDQLFPSTVNGWLWVISLALICQVLGHGLLTYSLAKFSSVVVSLVHLLEPVFSGIFALIIFSETLTFSNWVGFAVVLIGLYLAVSSQEAVNLPFQESVKNIINTFVQSMTFKLSLLKQQFSETPALLGTVSLLFALIPISLAPSLTKLCQQEIGANAVVFHRSWIATVVFGLWNGLEAFRYQQSVQEGREQGAGNREQGTGGRRQEAGGNITPALLDNQSVEKKPFTSQEVWLLLAMGTSAGTYLLLWAWSLSQTSVANVALLSNLNSLFVALAGYLLFGRRFDNRFVIGLIVALGGAIAFELNKVQFATDQILGDALALLTAVFMATCMLLIERLRTRFSTATIMLWRCGVTTMFLLPVLPFLENRLFPYSWTGWFFIIFQALFCQVLGQGLLAYSLSRISSGVVAVTLLLEPVLASIFAWFIFSEQVGLFDWATFAVVLAGIYLAQSSQSIVQVTNEGS